MALGFYIAMFVISLLLISVYAFIFHKHFDANLTIMAVLVPVINLGFLLMALSKTPEEAVVGLRFTYLGGCFLLPSAMFLIFSICGIPRKGWIRAVVFAVESLIFASTLTIGHSDIFYKQMPDIAFSGGAAYLTNKHYGFMHTVFYVMVGLGYAITLGTVIYSFFRKKQMPRGISILLLVAVSVAVLGFFGGRLITNTIEPLPATYNLGMIIYIIIASRLRLYDASDSVTDAIVEKGDTGFVSFDSKLRYLDSNETAKTMIPELSSLRVDHPIEDGWLKDNFLPLAHAYQADERANEALLKRGERYYMIHINTLMFGPFRAGLQFLVTDDTANQEHLTLMHSYQTSLEEEVERKTAHVIAMQEKLVLGMATMVEGRDNSTGGHIKRTSDCVAILVDEMKKGGYPLEPTFAASLIKAAPMHDLGKIAVDDRVLRKPGRFTPEEFEEMKKHAAEGAKILEKILAGIDDEEFYRVAINVAHYHHERFDGSGYPDKLKGEEIPFEARIMAIADVYDALVSKRVYKERMSFEEADRIIMEGMGSQFDPALKPYYVASRPRLEEYYKSLPQQE